MSYSLMYPPRNGFWGTLYPFCSLSGLELLFTRNAAFPTLFDGHELWWTEPGWEEWTSLSFPDASSSSRRIRVAPGLGTTTRWSQIREWKQHFLPLCQSPPSVLQVQRKGVRHLGLWGPISSHLHNSLIIFAISVCVCVCYS